MFSTKVLGNTSLFGIPELPFSSRNSHHCGAQAERHLVLELVLTAQYHVSLFLL